MGRDATFYCRDCKTSYYLGYGSCGSWMDSAKTVEEFDAIAARTDNASLAKNQNVRRCLEEHAGHKHETHSGDWTYIEGGTLFGEFGPMGAGVPLIENYSEWTHEDLYSDEYSPPSGPDVDPAASIGNAELDRKLAAWEARKTKS
jgi:hypothetical protein